MIRQLDGIHETVCYDTINGIRIYHNVETLDYSIHWHTAMEIIMPLENYYRITIDNVTYTVWPGDIFLIPPGTLHELQAPDTGSRTILLLEYAKLSAISGLDSLLHLLHPYTLIEHGKAASLSQELTADLNAITEEYQRNTPFAEASIYGMLLHFFTALGRYQLSITTRFTNINSSKQHEYIDKFMQVCNYISEHCTENISVEDMAALAGFSKFHFSRLFKQFSGSSCSEYLTQKRIAHAEHLLIDPDISIMDVAMQSGFNSLSTFNRIFKSVKGCTPSEYKNLNHTR